ncbi:hypothetical protein IHE44_0014113 [Lamprotornis superbus]|uniref:Uncharacterized protein n=1 Tax=Lamprotornis superbus TaxID=245042 RepID=A0A835NM55_9PASS|nr:hypothetical protein IHE44_0014113 [Lamprotornis superbus]
MRSDLLQCLPCTVMHSCSSHSDNKQSKQLPSCGITYLNLGGWLGNLKQHLQCWGHTKSLALLKDTGIFETLQLSVKEELIALGFCMKDQAPTPNPSRGLHCNKEQRVLQSQAGSHQSSGRQRGRNQMEISPLTPTPKHQHEMTMLITVSSSSQPVSNHHPLSPPPTLPKPGKDNLRLQRLLKKAARKNAILPSEQGKSFRSSLSPVNEASPDQERAESAAPAETPDATAAPSAPLPAHLPVRPIHHHAPSPFRKGKPFTLKVTEQRRIAEHVKLTASSAMPLLQKPAAPETPQQPEGMGSHLPPPADPSVSVFPQPPPSSTSSKERAPEVTYVTKVNTYFHSVKPPRAKTPTPNSTQEDKRPTSPAPQTSSFEPSPEQTPTSPKDSKATSPSPKPPLLPAAETELPDQAPKPAPTEKPSTSDAHTNKPTTHGSGTDISRSKTPELPKQDRDILKPSTSSTPWRQAHPATATPAQADGTGSTSTDTKVEHIPEPQVTPSLPKSSCPPKAEPAPPSVEAPRPPAASGWHRLRKHLMVQPEATTFPESKPEKLGQEEEIKEDAAQAVIKQDCTLVKSKAMRMWDAILYQVALAKEKKQQAEKKPQKEESVFLPRRLPILLHKPRFDARKLKELAAKPMTKISTVFEVSRFRPKGAEEHTKSFNRTASGWDMGKAMLWEQTLTKGKRLPPVTPLFLSDSHILLWAFLIQLDLLQFDFSFSHTTVLFFVGLPWRPGDGGEIQEENHSYEPKDTMRGVRHKVGWGHNTHYADMSQEAAIT